jgi:hypothetical protein
MEVTARVGASKQRQFFFLMFANRPAATKPMYQVTWVTAGLDAGETVTLPSAEDPTLWTNFDTAPHQDGAGFTNRKTGIGK